jgi:hypothetical protein
VGVQHELVLAGFGYLTEYKSSSLGGEALGLNRLPLLLGTGPKGLRKDRCGERGNHANNHHGSERTNENLQHGLYLPWMAFPN